ncbi:hypothetical protein [Nocardia pneumoniae]|uniref:hypothetical protein n=1 Tax=Nocardia pneumoniae TaxID=228601 RepID=UPI000594EC93|nr:hypothetical protein [Nocardia pneumoniae]
MDPQPSPRPEEDDVHLSPNVRVDFAACTTAASRFMQDWRSYHHPDAATVIPGDSAELPRLPCERLYLEPCDRGRTTRNADEWHTAAGKRE